MLELCNNHKEEQHGYHTLWPQVSQQECLRQRRRRHKKIEWLSKYKSENGCVTCGERRAPCLTFHHRDPNTKKFVISDFKNASMAKLLKEVAKCDVMCINCHTMLHYEETRRLMENE